MAKSSDKTRPHATIHLTTTRLPWRREKLDHFDVCLYMQFKKKDNPRNLNDDAAKLLWDVHQRFRCDPSCRFVCGLTIEDTTARFWQFSRAGVIASEPFDIIKDADSLIHIFVSLARADYPALGFDPTIECIGNEDVPASKRNYKIHVQDNKDQAEASVDRGQSFTFTTQCILANHLAVGIRTRGTWVFQGIDEGPNATPVVIKDVWIDSDREVEGTILENVRKTLEEEDLQWFLEPLCHGCVLINGEKDLTQPVLRSKTTTKFAYKVLTQTQSGKDPSGGFSVGSLPKLPTEVPIIIGHRGDPRKHYRIALKGKPGRALKDLTSSKEIFVSLLGAVKGLRALYKAGYIHRDLSAGNVLLVKEGEEEGHGAVIDLEYAKRFPDLSNKGHDVRTGTLAYMAAEVDARAFHFLPPPDLPDLTTLMLEDTEVSYSSRHVTVPWFHNPIHDMESAWWIAVWSFCRHNDSVNRSLFGTNTRNRTLTLLTNGYFRDNCPGIPERVMNLLDAWLTYMRRQYTELEKLVSNDSHLSFDYKAVFDTVIKLIKAIIAVIPPDSILATEEQASSAENFSQPRPATKGDV